MTNASTPQKPFRIDNPFDDPLRKSALAIARPVLEWLMKFPDLNAMHARLANQNDDRHYVDKILDDMRVTVEIGDEEIVRIPEDGPLIVVANHPFGGLEGLILSSIIRRVRNDVRLMANHLLHMVPGLRDEFIFVDPFDRPESVRKNIKGMRKAIDWVKDGGVLGVFPAGEVSHLTIKNRAVADPQWSGSIARLIKRTGATVLPVSFDGRNSDLFQVAGLVHARLRTLMLPRETLRRRASTVRARVGNPIDNKTMAKFKKPAATMAYLRVRTYILRDEQLTRSVAKKNQTRVSARRNDFPLIDPIDPVLLSEEAAQLPDEQWLVEGSDYQVFYARAPQIPAMIQELGRLRELTFRAVGEGTGNAFDTDRFDREYIHLIVWDPNQARIVGAYRMGPTDEILARHGKHGLYITTLFHIKKQLLDQIDPALELGRSFIHPDYQKEYAPLMLLWKGIGRFVYNFPRYRYLIGPVSISNDYRTMSKQLLMTFLTVNEYLPALGKMIKPKNPPHLTPPRAWDSKAFSTVVRDVNEVNSLLREIETDQKTMPVLLRQYLKLNAKLLGFNVDPDFGGVLDGLMLLDLTTVDRNVLNRYMGKDDAEAFLQYHVKRGARAMV